LKNLVQVWEEDSTQISLLSGKNVKMSSLFFTLWSTLLV